VPERLPRRGAIITRQERDPKLLQGHDHQHLTSFGQRNRNLDHVPGGCERGAWAANRASWAPPIGTAGWRESASPAPSAASPGSSRRPGLITTAAVAVPARRSPSRAP